VPLDIANTTSSSLAVCPLEPGRACIAGFYQRSWIGIATFDPKVERFKVEIFHEAREASSSADRDQWARTTVAFAPSSIVALRDKNVPNGSGAVRVILGRYGSEYYEPNPLPLMIDLEKRSVEVAKASVYDRGNSDDGSQASYQAEPGFAARLLHYAFPGATPKIVAEGLPTDIRILFRENDRFHIVQQLFGTYDSSGRFVKHSSSIATSANGYITHWHVVESGEKQPRIVGVNVPHVSFVAVSNYYGLVANFEGILNTKTSFHSVKFAPPAPSK